MSKIRSTTWQCDRCHEGEGVDHDGNPSGWMGLGVYRDAAHRGRDHETSWDLCADCAEDWKLWADFSRHSRVRDRLQALRRSHPSRPGQECTEIDYLLREVFGDR